MVVKVVRLVCYTAKEATKRPVIGGFQSGEVSIIGTIESNINQT